MPRSGGRGRASNNQSQNKVFRDATRELNRAQRERVRREVESLKRRYDDFGYDQIKELADEVKRQSDEHNDF